MAKYLGMVILFAALCVDFCRAAEPPQLFGVPLGMTKKELLRLHDEKLTGYANSWLKGGDSGFVAYSTLSFGRALSEVPGKASTTIQLADDQIISVTVVLDDISPKGWERIEKRLIEKFGESYPRSGTFYKDDTFPRDIEHLHGTYLKNGPKLHVRAFYHVDDSTRWVTITYKSEALASAYARRDEGLQKKRRQEKLNHAGKNDEVELKDNL